MEHHSVLWLLWFDSLEFHLQAFFSFASFSTPPHHEIAMDYMVFCGPHQTCPLANQDWHSGAVARVGGGNTSKEERRGAAAAARSGLESYLISIMLGRPRGFLLNIHATTPVLSAEQRVPEETQMRLGALGGGGGGVD